jgi:hypothetical protein
MRVARLTDVKSRGIASNRKWAQKMGTDLTAAITRARALSNKRPHSSKPVSPVKEYINNRSSLRRMNGAVQLCFRCWLRLKLEAGPVSKTEQQFHLQLSAKRELRMVVRL